MRVNFAKALLILLAIGLIGGYFISLIQPVSYSGMDTRTLKLVAHAIIWFSAGVTAYLYYSGK